MHAATSVVLHGMRIFRDITGISWDSASPEVSTMSFLSIGEEENSGWAQQTIGGQQPTPVMYA